MATVILPAVTRETLNQEFEELFRTHYDLIYRTAFGVTGSAQDAEDVLQTIFLRLLGREFPPDLTKNPKAYLYRAAVNVSLNAIRSRRRQVQIADSDSFAAVSETAGCPVDSEVQIRLLEAIAQLNNGAVQILMLRYVHNCSNAEIAQILGTTRGTVAVGLFRAKAQLRKLMRGSGDKS